MLVNQQFAGSIGCEFNCITNKLDATNHPEAKMSPSLGKLEKTFCWTDSFRSFHPNSTIFSCYYESHGISGATKIDRQYHWGGMLPI